MEATLPTNAQLTSLAWTAITGQSRKGMHHRTFMFALGHTEYVCDSADFPYSGMYRVKDDAPDYTGTKLWKTHASLLAEGWWTNDLWPERRSRGAKWIMYLRGADENPKLVRADGVIIEWNLRHRSPKMEDQIRRARSRYADAVAQQESWNEDARRAPMTLETP